MLLLASTTSKLQIVTSAAVALDVLASFVDNASGTITLGATPTVISTATTTDVVAAPGASTTRNVKHLSARARGGANTVTLKFTDGTTSPELIKVTLAQDEVLVFNDGPGFQILDSSGAVKLAAQPSAGRLIKTTVYTTGSGNHTTDAKCATIGMRLVGGGGGGAGAATAAASASCGAGGGGGAYVEKLVAVQPSTAYAYAVGAGGAGGVNTGGTGTTGGNSTLTIGGTTYTAGGGFGGVGQAAAATVATTLGGSGGAASSGDINISGGTGRNGNRQSGTVGWSGDGAEGIYCAGPGTGRYTAGGGGGAAGPGAGGGGALVLNASAAAVGGGGAAGLVIIDEYT
jgi:hypothetical protein